MKLKVVLFMLAIAGAIQIKAADKEKIAEIRSEIQETLKTADLLLGQNRDKDAFSKYRPALGKIIIALEAKKVQQEHVLDLLERIYKGILGSYPQDMYGKKLVDAIDYKKRVDALLKMHTKTGVLEDISLYNVPDYDANEALKGYATLPSFLDDVIKKETAVLQAGFKDALQDGQEDLVSNDAAVVRTALDKINEDFFNKHGWAWGDTLKQDDVAVYMKAYLHLADLYTQLRKFKEAKQIVAEGENNLMKKVSC